jgi:hypothetical protein
VLGTSRPKIPFAPELAEGGRLTDVQAPGFVPVRQRGVPHAGAAGDHNPNNRPVHSERNRIVGKVTRNRRSRVRRVAEDLTERSLSPASLLVTFSMGTTAPDT